MENSVSLDTNQYDEFLRVLIILKDICNDVDIREGIIRQRSNDLSTVFEIDLSHIISNLNIPITVLKLKLDMFKCFTGDEITITTDDEKFTISNQSQKISFKYPSLEYIDNKFIDEEELDRVIQTNEENLIITTNINKKISDMMRIVTSALHVNSVQVVFNGNEAKISGTNQAKDNHAEFMNGIVSNMELNHSANLVITPFVVDHDGDITFNMYENDNDIVCNSFITTIGDTNVKLYSRASLVEDGNV